MRFIIAAHPGPNSTPPREDAGFDENLFTAYMKFNEALHEAGVLVASEGLNPAGRGARVEAKGGKRVFVDGPFAESKELVGGFYVIDVPSLDDAIAWALKCPTGMGAADVLDIRPLTAESDLPPEIVQLIRKAAPKWSATFGKR